MIQKKYSEKTSFCSESHGTYLDEMTPPSQGPVIS